MQNALFDSPVAATRFGANLVGSDVTDAVLKNHQTRERFKELNQRTLKRLRNDTLPKEGDGKDLSEKIILLVDQCLRSVLVEIHRGTGLFALDSRRTYSLLVALWKYQYPEIRTKALDSNRVGASDYIKDNLISNAILYLSTMSHIAISQMSLPLDSPSLSVNHNEISDIIETALWAMYMKDKTRAYKGGNILADVKAHKSGYRDKYGYVDLHFDRGPINKRLRALKIIQHIPQHFYSFSSTKKRKRDLRDDWTPPGETGTWLPIPYSGTSKSTKGRLAAWADAYVKRPPAELTTLLGIKN